MNYWIVVVSRDHGQLGVKGGFIQANHGERSALDRMRPGDRLVIYSPRELHGEPGRLQAFTALGAVGEGEVWQAEMGPGFKPFRRRVDYEPVQDAPLLPLLEKMSFIRNKKSYGAGVQVRRDSHPAGGFRGNPSCPSARRVIQQLDRRPDAPAVAQSAVRGSQVRG